MRETWIPAFDGMTVDMTGELEAGVTRFGRWFTGAIVLVVALFVVGLLVPGQSKGPMKTVWHEPIVFTPNSATGGPISGARAWSGLIFPVADVTTAALSDTFGDPRGADGERGHGALDIMAPRGTPVLAAAGGRVEKLFESERGGHTLYVRSPNGRNIYYYAHLDTYAPGVREGVAVRAGQRIGTVGSSGDADPAAPHLHFEIKRMAPGQPWHEGAPINPYPLLAGKAAGG